MNIKEAQHEHKQRQDCLVDMLKALVKAWFDEAKKNLVLPGVRPTVADCRCFTACPLSGRVGASERI